MKHLRKNITSKVLNSERDISRKENQDIEENKKIIVVSTFGADDTITEAVKESEENLRKTQSFRNQTGPLFKFVKNVGPNIRSSLNYLKKQALGTKKGQASMCGGRGCKACRMLWTSPIVTIGNRRIKLTEGNCKSGNICYFAKCQICDKPYTGRTVELIHKRINGHRKYYKEILKNAENGTNQEIDSNSDLWMLGLHLHLDHGLTDPDAFDKYMKFGILEVVNPTEIEKKEYIWMHRLNTFQPTGLNIEYPFGIPFLGQN